MRLVREHINEKFTQDSDPIHDLGIGIEASIENWLVKEFNHLSNTSYGFLYSSVISYRDSGDIQKANDSLLVLCANEGKTEFVDYLLKHKNVDVHHDVDLALRRASHYGHAEIVKLLIDAGADVHANKNDALAWACDYGRTKVVKILLDAGANPLANYAWPLQQAIKTGKLEIIKDIKTRSKNKSAVNKYLKDNYNIVKNQKSYVYKRK